MATPTTITGFPTLGRLSRGRDMLSKRGHLCTFQVNRAGLWACGHNDIVWPRDARDAVARAAALIAATPQPRQASADGTGRSVAVAAEPVSERPACPTTGPTTVAGGPSEAFARAS